MAEEDFWLGWAKFGRYAEIAVWLIVVLGSAIAFCPVWSGDWSPPQVRLWIEAVGMMAIVVWLFTLSNSLRRDGHVIHAALVLALGLPMSHAAEKMIHGGAGIPPLSLREGIDLLFGGYLGLCVLAGIVVLSVGEAIGRKSGWRRFEGLGLGQPTRTP